MGSVVAFFARAQVSFWILGFGILGYIMHVMRCWRLNCAFLSQSVLEYALFWGCSARDVVRLLGFVSALGKVGKGGM